MSNKEFPRTMVGGVSLPRMLIGSNWFCGYSHTGSAADAMIKNKFSNEDAFIPVIKEYLKHNINAIMGLFETNPTMLSAVKSAEQKFGKEIIIIDTPIVNVDDSKSAREEAKKTIELSKKNGAKFCFLHHSSVEQLIDKNKKVIHRLDDYTKMIRDAGMIPGLSAHMPEVLIYSDANEYDVETYIQIYNCLGFLMQVEIEYIAKVINSAKKPVMTIKPFAAGRCTPYVGLNFSYNTIRECDMVTVGAYSELEVREDIEIAYAALGRYYPNLEGRTSPAKNQDVFMNNK